MGGEEGGWRSRESIMTSAPLDFRELSKHSQDNDNDDDDNNNSGNGF